jgi:repressor LexA
VVKGITERQKELLTIIYRHIEGSGYPPTFEEMRESLGVVSNQSVVDLLEKLKTKSLVKKEEGSARGLAITPLGYEALGEPPLAPVLGETAAGSPVEVIERIGEWQTISPEVARPKDDVFLLKISGDSMINAGIDDGDVVLVKEQKEFVSGDIVLAQINDESTVKRFISSDTPPYLYLKPENPKYENILITEETRLLGKIISVMKEGQWDTVK